MRILLSVDPEIPVPPKLYGGIERIVNSLIVELRQRGHAVGLLANAASTVRTDCRFTWPGERSGGVGNSLANTRAMRRAVRSYAPDVIHSYSRLMYLLGVLDNSTPRIMSFQRAPTYRTVRYSSKLAGTRLVFTGCSDYICREGRRGGGIWFPIPNFVDLSSFTFVASVPCDAPLVFLSRVESIKGAHIAIEAAKRTGRRLLIAGNHAQNGSEHEYWKNRIEPELSHENIEYVGPVDDEAKNALLGSAAAMIVPIQWDEPFGIVFAEALACGTPVISCPRGALPEIIDDGIEGFLKSDLESMCDAVLRIAEIDRARCRKKAETHFSSQVVTSKYESLYAQLTGSEPHR